MLTTKVSWKGGQLSRSVHLAGIRGVNKALERLRGLAVAEAPLRDGPLRESAYVDPAGGDAMAGRVGFDTPYAARQHEERDYRHTQGRAGYLADVMEEHQAELGQIIAAEVRRVLK